MKWSAANDMNNVVVYMYLLITKTNNKNEQDRMSA